MAESDMKTTVDAPKSVVDIYFLANTPYYLYAMLRRDSFVISLSSKDSNTLIQEFKDKANAGIRSQEEMASLYATLVALTFKPMAEVRDFMSSIKEGASYEWFPDIINLFFANYKDDLVFNNIVIENNKEDQLVSTYNV